MRKSISWVLLLGLFGCGNSDPAPDSAQAPAPGAVAAELNTALTPQKISPEAAVTLAQELIQKREFNAASKLLNDAIRANPQLVDAYTTRASILAEAKLYTRAIHDMDVALQLQPDNAKYYNTRGYFHLLLQNHGPAMDDFNQAIALAPNYAQPLNNRGLVRIALSRSPELSTEPDTAIQPLDRSDSERPKKLTELDKAIKEFDAALRIDGKYVDAHNNRGFALSLSKQYDEAVVSFTHAIELNDKYVNAWNNRGQAQSLAGHHDLAIADFTQAIALQPSTMEYYEQRAEAYQAAGRAELARQDLDHVEWSYTLDALNRQLNSDPKNPQNWVARGNHLQHVARWDEAVKNYQDALQRDPLCVAAQVGLALVLYRQQKLEEALAACNAILKAAPHRDAASLRGDILFERGEYDAAITDYKFAQRFDAQVAQAYFKRAEQRKATGEIQQASADLIQAVRMDPRLKAQAPDVIFPEDETPVSVAPRAFPGDETVAAPIPTSTPIAPTAIEPTAVEPAAP